MKPKGDCQECGRHISMSKMHRSKIDGRLLCSYCFNRENASRLKYALEDVIIEPLSNSIKKQKTTLKSANLAKPTYFTRDEIDVLKAKHKNNSYNAIYQLRKYTSNSIKKNTIIPKINNDLNKKLLEGLK